MGTWYAQFTKYCEKVEITTKEIKDQTYYSDLPGPLTMKYLSISSDNKWYRYAGPEKLKDFLYKLQFFAHLNSHLTDRKAESEIRMKILGQRITFYLTESFIPSVELGERISVRGRQILFKVNDNGKKKMTEYKDIMPDLEAYSSIELGNAMIKALNTSLFDQTSEGLEESIIRPATLFILLTHIPEAAIPFKSTLDEFERAVRYNTTISKNAKDKIVILKRKTGRVPMADKIARRKLRDVQSDKITFTAAFSEDNYPLRRKGGTQDGRTWVLKDQNGELTGNLSDSDGEDEGMKLSGLLKNKTPIFTPEP